MSKLQDKVALVTGGSRGLGFVLAREFGRRGCKVAICARDAMDLEEARADVAADRVDVLAVPCDVGDRAAVERMVAEVTEHYGRIDVLVNNAGIMAAGPLASQRVEDFERLMQVMFWGAVYPTLAVLPQMRARRGGHVATITSIGGKIVAPHMLPYNAAKFAAVGFSEGLRAELSGSGVEVTTVVPGFMRTGGHVHARFKGDAATEARVFGALSNAPLLSMDVERAARKIVDAIEKGEAEIVLGASARLGMWVNGVAPGFAARLMGFAGRPLPESSEAHGKGVRGEEFVEPNKPARQYQR